MSTETEEVVKVLYDYTYTDESGEIEIKTGDIYRLIEKTNNEWWQVYDPSEEEGYTFFVPAHYVEIVSQRSPYKAISDLDKLLTFGENQRPERLESEEDPYSKSSDFWQHNKDLPTISNEKNSGSADPDYINTSHPVPSSPDDGEYVNLDTFRDAAGISVVRDGEKSGADPPQNLDKCNTLTKPPTIPQELIQGTVPPPLPEEGKFIKILVQGMPWDIYKEPTAGRLYYVNRETGERMWKPPRKDKPSEQSSPTSPQQNLPGATTAPAPPGSGNEAGWSGIPSEYEQVHHNGSVYFIHKSTQEKWKSLVDKMGRQYFHKVGSKATEWTLPVKAQKPVIPENEIVSDSTEQSVQQRDVNWESQGHRLSTFGGQSLRTTKAMSTYGHLESSAGSRASTLPANFTVARPAPVAHERSASPSITSNAPRPHNPPSSDNSGSLHLPEEIFEGYLNKTKILDVNKKKVKKNWTQVYVVLQGSNLVFYKDQKSATQRLAGSPNTKTEGVISLQGAHVDLNPKELTSKRNTISLRTSFGGVFLFQSDSEKNTLEWFTRMKIVANDVSPAESSPKDFDVQEQKKDEKKSDKAMARSVSADDTASLQGVDKNRNMVGIRAKLLNLISRRPTQEDLYKRGIIKDAVFGARLHELCDREKVNVPNFVHRCIAAVESKGLTHDGMYRISGNMAEIQRLRCCVDKDDSYNLYDEQWDVHVLTGALKLFFRELKEPVFPYNMYNKFSDAIKKESRKDKLSAFKSAVSDLPRCNYNTLKELFQHLRKVVEASHRNRMQTQNIAIVFGPTLLWQQEEAGSLAVQAVFQSKIVEFMLLEYTELFK